jgi:hypothetical protein
MENNTQNWIETKRKLQQQFEMLSNHDLRQQVIAQEEILLKIQATLGKTKEEIRKLISIEESKPSIIA